MDLFLEDSFDDSEFIAEQELDISESDESCDELEEQQSETQEKKKRKRLKRRTVSIYISDNCASELQKMGMWLLVASLFIQNLLRQNI